MRLVSVRQKRLNINAHQTNQLSQQDWPLKIYSSAVAKIYYIEVHTEVDEKTFHL